MGKWNRRDFLSGVTAAVMPSLAIAQSRSANEKVGIAVCGSGRGASLARFFSGLDDSQVVAICDVDENRGRPLCEQIRLISGKQPDYVMDFRYLLERSDVDAVVVATPDHWHSPITIHSCMAGKDVYVEKPLSHNVAEGRLAVQIARKYKRVVQHGTNLRASPHYQEAWKLLQKGIIGKVLMAKAINNQKRPKLKDRADEPVPAGVNYDLWLGPARKQAFNQNRFHGSWHWMREYGTGDIGNDGVHQIDLGRWALGLKSPKAVSCSGAKLGWQGGAQEFPDAMVVTWEYDDFLYVFEQRDFTPYRMTGHRLDNDNIFYGDEGFMMIDRDGYRVFYRDQKGPSSQRKWVDQGRHYQNFIDCVKSRKHEDLIADIEEGHYSSLLCHLGNIAYFTGRRLEFDPRSETFPSDTQANELLHRQYREGFELPVS